MHKKTPVMQLAQKCRKAASHLLTLDTSVKNSLLCEMSVALKAASRVIIKKNELDLRYAERQGLSAAMKERLALNEKAIGEMAVGLEEVAQLPDPVGQIVREWTRPNGLKVQKKRIPLGVVAVVYESRPNVTVDSAGLCLKSGNAVILRGGKEAINSNMILGKIMQGVLQSKKIPKEGITVIPTSDREVLRQLLQLSGLIDVAIPRGGEGLMKFMEKNSRVPVIKHDKGVCNLFVDESADIETTLRVVENSKVQRPGVCNALENLFVHEKIAPDFLPRLNGLLSARGVELRGDLRTRKILPGIKRATNKDWETEYLDLILSIGLVSGIDDAIEKIRKYGSRHTESIMTASKANAEKFVDSLDSSCVLVNASTRFNDGGQLGLGAEIGISTTKLHAFGPMGLEELTTTKFVVYGQGQVRA